MLFKRPTFCWPFLFVRSDVFITCAYDFLVWQLDQLESLHGGVFKYTI